jgi:hypothetical protein
MKAWSFALPPWARAWTMPGSVKRRLLLALGVYLLCTVAFFASTPREHVTEHTKYNHYALLADSWLRGQFDLGHQPPAYTQNNDFAEFKGRWYITFPPFPAVLLLPWSKIAGTPENLRDGQVWLWFAGLGPSFLFLALEKLRRMGENRHSEMTSLALSWMFAFGTVYFFSAVQGTVWFAAHVVAVALAALFLLCALEAERPLVAGTAVGLLFLTRPPMLLIGILFVLEAWRTHRARGDWTGLARKLALFSLPVAALCAVFLWYNRACFGSVFSFGHEHLAVNWHARIQKWGLFSYHYLARNLGIALTSLPYVNKAAPHVQVNTHGLALWVTTPAYLWLLWPKKTGWLFWSLAATAAPVVLADLLYQNSGWMQFGYRFSNDFAVFLFALLAIGGFRLGRRFWAAALFGVIVNTLGALTFDRQGYERYYYSDGSQNVIYQPD